MGTEASLTIVWKIWLGNQFTSVAKFILFAASLPWAQLLIVVFRSFGFESGNFFMYSVCLLICITVAILIIKPTSCLMSAGHLLPPFLQVCQPGQHVLHERGPAVTVRPGPVCRGSLEPQACEECAPWITVQVAKLARECVYAHVEQLRSHDA